MWEAEVEQQNDMMDFPTRGIHFKPCLSQRLFLSWIYRWNLWPVSISFSKSKEVTFSQFPSVNCVLLIINGFRECLLLDKKKKNIFPSWFYLGELGKHWSMYIWLLAPQRENFSGMISSTETNDIINKSNSSGYVTIKIININWVLIICPALFLVLNTTHISINLQSSSL